MTVELKFGAWYQYWPDFLSPTEAEDLVAALTAETDWEVREIFALGKPILQPRLMRWGGDIDYRYSGQTLPAKALPPYLARLMTAVSDHCQTPFNHLVINRYRDGTDHMSLHADNEPELGRNPTIAAISLGVERVFTMVPKSKKGRRKHTQKLKLAHGSLLVMGGRMQHTWRHAVPKASELGERFNITFRWLKEPPRFQSNATEGLPPSTEQIDTQT